MNFWVIKIEISLITKKYLHKISKWIFEKSKKMKNKNSIVCKYLCSTKATLEFARKLIDFLDFLGFLLDFSSIFFVLFLQMLHTLYQKWLGSEYNHMISRLWTNMWCLNESPHAINIRFAWLIHKGNKTLGFLRFWYENLSH